MSLTDREAYELDRHGKAVIVNCADCGIQVWTDGGAEYDGDAQEWLCDSCSGGSDEQSSRPVRHGGGFGNE